MIFVGDTINQFEVYSFWFFFKFILFSCAFVKNRVKFVNNLKHEYVKLETNYF